MNGTGNIYGSAIFSGAGAAPCRRLDHIWTIKGGNTEVFGPGSAALRVSCTPAQDSDMITVPKARCLH